MIKFFKTIGQLTQQGLCLSYPYDNWLLKKHNFSVIVYDLKDLWLNTVVSSTKRHGVTWITKKFQHPIF